jgi:hypothetical protein
VYPSLPRHYACGCKLNRNSIAGKSIGVFNRARRQLNNGPVEIASSFKCRRMVNCFGFCIGLKIGHFTRGMMRSYDACEVAHGSTLLSMSSNGLSPR